MLVARFAIQIRVTKLTEVFNELITDSNFLFFIREKFEHAASPYLAAGV